MNHRITIHCSASSNGHPYKLEQLKKDHVARGFTDIGYHFIIQPSGKIEIGRDEDTKGAHVEGENTGNIGICLIGYDRFTLAQFDSLRHLLDRFILSQQIMTWNVFGHYEFESAKRKGKTCPNLRIADVMVWYLDDAQGAIDKYILQGKAA